MPQQPPARMTVNWALWGPDPDAAGHRVQALARLGPLGPDRLSAVITRHQAGTPRELPQVTFGWEGSGDGLLTVGVHEWSGERDGFGRQVAHTRFYYFGYPGPDGHAVGYEGLYTALAERWLPADDPLEISVPRLDTAAAASRAGAAERLCAALLLTGRPVRITGARDLSLLDRVRFLDTVAALLPYGMRARLSAATWTSATAETRIRLSFSDSPGRDGAHTVPLNGLRTAASLEGRLEAHPAAGAYLKAMTEIEDLRPVLWSLSREMAPLRFREAAEPAMDLLAKAAPTHHVPKPQAAPKPQAPPEREPAPTPDDPAPDDVRPPRPRPKTTSKATTPKAAPKAAPGKERTPPEPSTSDMVIGCTILLGIAAAVIGGLVALVMMVF